MIKKFLVGLAMLTFLGFGLGCDATYDEQDFEEYERQRQEQQQPGQPGQPGF